MNMKAYTRQAMSRRVRQYLSRACHQLCQENKAYMLHHLDDTRALRDVFKEYYVLLTRTLHGVHLDVTAPVSEHIALLEHIVTEATSPPHVVGNLMQVLVAETLKATLPRS
jgi:hypothetical protein